jgi:hypothetical protein
MSSTTNQMSMTINPASGKLLFSNDLFWVMELITLTLTEHLSFFPSVVPDNRILL